MVIKFAHIWIAISHETVTNLKFFFFFSLYLLSLSLSISTIRPLNQVKRQCFELTLQQPLCNAIVIMVFVIFLNIHHFHSTEAEEKKTLFQLKSADRCRWPRNDFDVHKNLFFFHSSLSSNSSAKIDSLKK